MDAERLCQILWKSDFWLSRNNDEFNEPTNQQTCVITIHKTPVGDNKVKPAQTSAYLGGLVPGPRFESENFEAH